MKLFTTIAALTLIAAPVQAQLNHTGRYYGPNGGYTKCTTVGSYTNHSTFCKSGAAARDEDRRLAAKNACTKRVKEDHAAKYGQKITNQRMVNEYGLAPSYETVGMHDSEFYTKLGKPQLIDDRAYIAYRAAIKSCFTANGFN